MLISIVLPEIGYYGRFDPCKALENFQNLIFFYVRKKIAESHRSIYYNYSRKAVLPASLYPTNFLSYDVSTI